MTPRFSCLSLVLLLLAAGACLDRKKGGDASVPSDLGTPDGTATPIVDTSTLDGTAADTRRGDGGTDTARPDTVTPTLDLGGTADVHHADVGSSDVPADVPPPSPDAATDLLPDAPADVPPDVPQVADTAKDIVPDPPTPDAPGTCPAGQKPCSASGSCIDATACCVPADCPGTCQTCNASHACVAVISQADPNGRCLGTCDSAGACRSKKGQTCQTVAAGCEAGTTCSPDGICCDNGCISPCMACDIPGFIGTCTPVASGNPHGNRTGCGSDAECAGTCAGHVDGTCQFPTKTCGSGPICSGTDGVIPKGSCFQGACTSSAAQPCTAGFLCTAGACKTSCSSDDDCQTNYFCQSGTCHAKVVQVALGEQNVCAVDVTGSVYCWGRNSYGILGQDPSALASSNKPVKINNLVGVKSVAVGSDFACAVTTSGGAYCWGYGGSGRLGSTPSGDYSTSPLGVTGLSTGVATIVASHSSACAQTASNAVWCWGDNIYKELGSGVSGSSSATPTNIGPPGTTSVSVGSQTICAIAASVVYCWGKNSNGQAGAAGGGSVASPTQVSGIVGSANPLSVSTNGHSSCAATSGGVLCWGWNSYGALGTSAVAIGSDSYSAVPVQALATGASVVSVGFLHACALLSSRYVACWGLQRYGALGDGVTGSDNYTLTASTLTALGTVSMVATSNYHSCAVRTNGSLACWGYGYWGEMGNSVSADASTPVDVTAW